MYLRYEYVPEHVAGQEAQDPPPSRTNGCCCKCALKNCGTCYFVKVLYSLNVDGITSQNSGPFFFFIDLHRNYTCDCHLDMPYR